MTTTYRDLFQFLNLASVWLAAHPAESKFRYALRKVVKQGERFSGEYQERLEEITIEHCATDPKTQVILKQVLKDARGNERVDYEFTKEGLKKRNEARKALFESAIEVNPFVATDVPPDLTEDEREAFAGFVLPPRVDA